MELRVDSFKLQRECEIEFNHLPLWKKAAAVAFVAFSTLFSFGILFETSFQYIVGRLSVRREDAATKKVKKVDLTKQRVSLSDLEKEQLEKHFDEWFKKANYKFSETTKRGKALKLAAFYVLDNKKDNSIKLALADILQARFKKEAELERIANCKPTYPIIPDNSRKENFKEFVINTERKKPSGEVVVVEKEYRRWQTAGAGDCAFHALFGEQINGVFRTDHQQKRAKFLDHLKNCKLPDSITAQFEEVFEQLCNRQAYDLVKDLKSLFVEKFKKDDELKAINTRLAQLNLQKSFSDDDKKEIEELESKIGNIQIKFYDDPEVKKTLVKNLKKTIKGCSEDSLSEIISKEHIPLSKIFKWLCRDAKVDRSGIIEDYIKILNTIYENEYKSQIQEILQQLSAFEGINIKALDPTAAEARLSLIKQYEEIKAKFVHDPQVKAAFIKRIGQSGVELFQHELIELAKSEKIPLILHQKENDGSEISTKYINGEIVPNNRVHKEKDPASKIDWKHVYYEASHYERVTKTNVKIDFKRD